ncbi:MAG: hypothetical protein QXJ52_05575 [Candidatus Korarchaeota archaeon]
MKASSIHENLRNNLLKYIIPTVFLVLIISAILRLFGATFQTEFLPGGRGSIEYAYLSGVAEKMGYSRPYTFYVLLVYLLAPLVGDLLLAAKISVVLLLAIYLVGLYLLASFYSSRWIGLLVLLTAFFPLVPDTLFKGDYMSLANMVFTTFLFLGLTLLLRGMYTKVGTTFVVLSSLLLPFGDPTMLSVVTLVLTVTVIVFYVLKRQMLIISILITSIFAGTGLLSVTLNGSFTDGLWRPNPIEQFTSNLIITFVLLVSAATGAFNLYQKGCRKELTISLSWIIASVISSAFWPQGLALAFPLISALAPSSLIFWKETIKLRKLVKNENEPYYEIEIDVGLVLRCVSVLLLAVLLILAIPSTIMLGNYESQPQARIEDIKDASLFLQTVATRQLIVAHPSIANWLATTSNLTVLPTVNFASFEIADLLTTSSFRIITQHLKVDDWQPFSAAKAPLIHIYDGKTYRPFLYIDDSYSRITLIGPNGEQYIESPYKARYLEHKWAETEREITLELRFQSAGLLINKSISVSKSNATVTITYKAKVIKEGFRITSFMLNVYSVTLAELPQLDLSGSRGYMKINGHQFFIDYSGNLIKLTQDKTKDQIFVIGVFRSSDESSAEGAVTISSPTAVSSGREPWYASFIDLAKKLSVRYVIIPKEHQIFIEGALPIQLENFWIKDSFVRYIINSEGKYYQEAPAFGRVLNETIEPNMREVWYRTAGLNIKKILKTSDGFIDIMYEAKPHKKDTHLILSTLSVWIDWGRIVLSFSIEKDNRTVRLSLDSAMFTLHLKGNVSSVVLERHPEFGQNRVLVTYYLDPEGDSFGLSIESSKPLIVRYNPTTRPEMKDEDSLIILNEAGVFKPVKDLKLYTIFEITPP